jgi:hypothetical protein
MKGMSGFTSGIFNSFVKDLENVGTIEIIDLESEKNV